MDHSISHLTQRIQALARSTTARSKKPPRPNKKQLQYIVQHEADSLQAKLATSPYAAILASPLRCCTFHRKHYPSKLLQRFEVGLHPKTRTPWAFPINKGDGHGYYVKLDQTVLDQVQKRDHRRLFRGSANYPTNMSALLHQRMITSLVDQVPSVKYTPFHYNQQLQQQPSMETYQCILLLQPPSSTTTTTTTTTTLYDDDMIVYPLYMDAWQPLYDAVTAHLQTTTLPDSLGVVKSMDSVAFAVDLFRYSLWLRSSPTNLKRSS